ncbi:MAG: carbon-nitrogen hydrolase family protein [Acidimicrobiales bacterium]
MARQDDTFHVGVVNFAAVFHDKAATLDKIEASIVEAAAQGIDLLAFPEEALIGAAACEGCRSVGGACDEHVGLAETVPGPATERVAKLAEQHDMYVMFGFAERDRADSRRLYNAVAVIGPDGIQGTYRKIHLGSPPWVTEGITFAPGNALPVWNTRWGPVGVLICYDFWLNPELSRILALKGAQLIVNCSASFAGPGKREYFMHTTEVRALENQIYTASSNFVGGDADRGSYGPGGLDKPRVAHWGGSSTIAGPAFPRFSHIYASASVEHEEIVSAVLSRQKLERWRAVYPWQQWRRGHQREVSKLIAREFDELARD